MTDWMRGISYQCQAERLAHVRDVLQRMHTASIAIRASGASERWDELVQLEQWVDELRQALDRPMCDMHGQKVGNDGVCVCCKRPYQEGRYQYALAGSGR